MAKLVEIIAANDELGEGPVWSVGDGRLWWTDIQGRRLRSLDPSSGVITDVATPERVGSYALVAGRPGTLLTAFETGLAYFDVKTGAVEWLFRPEAPGSGRRFNDGRVDRHGRFWTGTMIEDEAKSAPASASLWRIDHDGAASAHVDGVKISNGLAFSPDGRTAYFADSPLQQIYAYDLHPETGALSNKRLFVQVERGYPDGGTVDAEGCLWSARWGAGEVVRHAPDGREIQVLKTAASQPTCMAFGGANLTTLFVTSAYEGLTEAQRAAESSSGDLFVFELDTPGLAEVEFRFGATHTD